MSFSCTSLTEAMLLALAKAAKLKSKRAAIESSLLKGGLTTKLAKEEQTELD